MRGFLLLIIILGSLPVIFAKPYVGALMWSWVSYMNPHRLVYGGLSGFPIAMVVGGVTIAAWLISRQPKSIPWTPPVILLIVFTAWISITTLFADVRSLAIEEWIETLKVLLMTFVMASLVNTRKQMDMLIWVIVISIGFFGVRGGIFVGATGGGYLVWGPPKSYIAANNAIGMALLMVIPMMRYLQLQTAKNWVKWGLTLSMLLSGVAVLGTHSRGALVAAACMIIALWFKSRKKLLFGIGIVFASVVILSLFPQEWWDRMHTIQTYEEDKSAGSRLEMWQFGIDIANDNLLFGGGFGVWTQGWLYEKYDVLVKGVKSVHSIYFQVLGEHGYIGLLLYLAIGFLTYRVGSKLIKLVRDKPEHTWAGDLSSMVQVSMVGFAAGGAFLNKAYFDLYFHFVVIMALTSSFVKQAIEEKNAAKAPPDGTTVPSNALPGTPARAHHQPGKQPGGAPAAVRGAEGYSYHTPEKF